MIIDFHTHNFPAALAKRALEVMCGKLAECGHEALRPVGDGTVDTELRDMDASGIDLCVNCPVATTPGNFNSIFRRALELRNRMPRIVQLASIHPLDPDFREHISMLRDNGIPGIKLHPNYQGIRLDNPQMVPFFTALRDNGLFVISHCGFDPGYVNAPPVASPHAVAKLLSAVPGLRFVAAHLGGEYGSPPHAVDELLQFDTCLIDTAAMYFRFDAEEAMRLVREWPANRIVFGTDYFWRDQAYIRAWVESLRSDPAEREMIFHGNAETLLGMNERK